MGMGDEIMVTGEVVRRNIRRAQIWDVRKGIARWHEMWQGNPRIARPGEEFDTRLVNCGGHRPYIIGKGSHKWDWREYQPHPGELFLSPEEVQFSRFTSGAVVLNPTIKDGASVNKSWGMERWTALVHAYPNVPWVQLGPSEAVRLPGVRFIVTPTFRHACGALSGARAAVLHEGGLHHAAAALGIPAVVIYGGFISPKSTGYALHRNIFDKDREFPLGCGMRFTCPHCRSRMEAISPSRVYSELDHLLRR